MDQPHLDSMLQDIADDREDILMSSGSPRTLEDESRQILQLIRDQEQQGVVVSSGLIKKPKRSPSAVTSSPPSRGETKMTASSLLFPMSAQRPPTDVSTASYDVSIELLEMRKTLREINTALLATKNHVATLSVTVSRLDDSVKAAMAAQAEQIAAIDQALVSQATELTLVGRHIAALHQTTESIRLTRDESTDIPISSKTLGKLPETDDTQLDPERDYQDALALQRTYEAIKQSAQNVAQSSQAAALPKRRKPRPF